jgi:hypothetical protein
MNTERMFDIILTELALDKLKYEEQLEQFINDDKIKLKEKLRRVKLILANLTITEMNIAKFSSMISPTQKQEKQNGEI